MQHFGPLNVMRFVVPAVVAVLASGAALNGQQSLHFHSASSELVVLTATVTDKRGGCVHGVGRDRFTIYDDGKQQSISLFSNDDTPASVALIIDSSATMRAKIGEVVAATVAFPPLSHPTAELVPLAS